MPSFNYKCVSFITCKSEHTSKQENISVRGISSLDSACIIYVRHDNEYSVHFARLQFDPTDPLCLKSTVIAWFTARA